MHLEHETYEFNILLHFSVEKAATWGGLCTDSIDTLQQRVGKTQKITRIAIENKCGIFYLRDFMDILLVRECSIIKLSMTFTTKLLQMSSLKHYMTCIG